ncbi:MAG: phosphatidylglycerophosphatase A [Acidobacteria bacterium]|jgi:phosphatidylglycerophosphatase A|nr:phosphatidylglycerophosphatase A [Acidobacteriota bacterium]
MRKIWIAIATFFGCGYLPVAPGTWASLLTVLIVYFTPLAHAPLGVLVLVSAVVFVVGIPAASASEAHFAARDPRPVVIDEVAGQLVSLWLLPHQPGYFIGAFFLFRFFDIFKPFPVNRSEALPRGLGIMVDDVLAGAYAMAVLLLARHFIFS